jgi:hypothetical protein
MPSLLSTRLMAALVIPAAVVGIALTSAQAADAATPSASDTFELTLKITNNTDMSWTFDPADSRSGDDSHAHWGERPEVTLAAHTSETVSTMTDDSAALDTQVTYQMANGDYSSVEAVDWLNTENQFITYGASTAPPPYQYNEINDPGWPTLAAYTSTVSIPHGDHITASYTLSPTA